MGALAHADKQSQRHAVNDEQFRFRANGNVEHVNLRRELDGHLIHNGSAVVAPAHVCGTSRHEQFVEAKPVWA